MEHEEQGKTKLDFDERTSWIRPAILITAGVAVAFQVGKVPVALPQIQRDLGLSLVGSGWIVSIFSLIAAFGAAFFGIAGDRFGQWRLAVAGLAIACVAGTIGAFATTGAALLATRVAEGFGFLMTVTSIPPLIMRSVPGVRRSTALAFWGLYLPVGSFLLLGISGVILENFDWRILWLVTVGLIACAMVPLVILRRDLARKANSALPPITLRDAARPITMAGPLLISAIFALYAGQYMILTGFLPSIFIDVDGFGTAAAASVATVAVMANAIGNALSGVLHNRGYRSSTLIMIGASGITVTSFAFFFVTLPVEIRIIAAIVFGATGGLIPSSLFASMPAVAPDGTNISALSGMLTQGSAMGLLVGPPAVAACVSWFGSWHAAIPCMVILGGLCILGGHALQRFEDR